MQLNLDRDGAQLLSDLVGGELLEELEAVLSVRPHAAGVRIGDDPELSDWISARSPLADVARSLLGPAAKPVRAILFDKTQHLNWALGWHQDRTIAVQERIDAAGFENWTVKAGTTHVEPPFAILERMITVRVHVDAVGAENAPLLIVPGSHRLGRIVEGRICGIVEAHGKFECVARAGDVWIYSTPILHASEASRRPANRRVLQIDFSADRLPCGLRWAGIASA